MKPRTSYILLAVLLALALLAGCSSDRPENGSPSPLPPDEPAPAPAIEAPLLPDEASPEPVIAAPVNERLLREYYYGYHYDEDGIYSWVEYRYDANGVLVESQGIWSDGSRDGRVVYIYDAEGRLIKKEGYTYTTDELGSWIEYEYDANSNLVAELVYKVNSQSDKSAELDAERYTMYDQWNNPIKDTHTYTYDAAGHIIYDYHEFNSCAFSYVYDEYGRLLEKTDWDTSVITGELEPEFTRVYIYDSPGNLILEYTYDVGLSDSLYDGYAYTYDEFNRCIRKESIDGEVDYETKELVESWVITWYVYEYGPIS